MAPRVFEGDPSIADDERLFRRIPRTWVEWDEQGNASISSAAFKAEELSINIESLGMDVPPPTLFARIPAMDWRRLRRATPALLISVWHQIPFRRSLRMAWCTARRSVAGLPANSATARCGLLRHRQANKPFV
jgi:hypothetical protein